MSRQKHYNKLLLKKLEELNHTYPSFNIGRHIATALSDYGDFWGISDKEFLFALEKYQAELALDEANIAPEEFVYRIQQDGEHLFDNKEEEDEDEY